MPTSANSGNSSEVKAPRGRVPTYLYGCRVVVHAHRARWKVSKIASDSTADVETPAGPQASQVPAVGALHVETGSPARPTLVQQPVGVGRVARIGVVPARDRSHSLGLLSDGSVVTEVTWGCPWARLVVCGLDVSHVDRCSRGEAPRQ